MTALITVSAPARRRAPEPPDPAFAPLSYDRFWQLVMGCGLELDVVSGIYRQRFPTGPSSRHIDDAQRGRVWWDLVRAGAVER